MKYLLHNGANINGKNKNGQTPIVLAALYGHISVAKYLYLKGAGFHYQKTKKLQDVTPHVRIF